MNDVDRLPIILPFRGEESYYVSVTGLSRHIDFEWFDGNCMTATIAHEEFTFGADARYRLSVMRRRSDSGSTPEIEVDVTFTTSMLTQYIVAGLIGTGLLGLLLGLARVVRNTKRGKRLEVVIDFIKYELFLSKTPIKRPL